MHRPKDFSGLHMAPARIATRLTCFALISATENDLRSSIKLRIGSNGRVRAAEGPVRGVKGLTMNAPRAPLTPLPTHKAKR